MLLLLSSSSSLLLVFVFVFLARMNRFERMIDVYLDPVELNGDEYQNIEIAKNNGINQTRPDSLNFVNDVSRLSSHRTPSF